LKVVDHFKTPRYTQRYLEVTQIERVIKEHPNKERSEEPSHNNHSIRQSNPNLHPPHGKVHTVTSRSLHLIAPFAIQSLQVLDIIHDSKIKDLLDRKVAQALEYLRVLVHVHNEILSRPEPDSNHISQIQTYEQVNDQNQTVVDRVYNDDSADCVEQVLDKLVKIVVDGLVNLLHVFSH
jgi:hypothetical protein